MGADRVEAALPVAVVEFVGDGEEAGPPWSPLRLFYTAAQVTTGKQPAGGETFRAEDKTCHRTHQQKPV